MVLDEERAFALDELFFSTTNMRGFITSGNPVFVRVSDYAKSDLIGKPHSVIRHPDMPRAVFKILWDALKAKKPLAAYVKNLAADGRHYWVMAIAVPIKNGYLSIRLKPSSSLQPRVEATYRAVRSMEILAESQGKSRSEILNESVPALVAGLAELGFADYDAFQHVALPKEIASRRSKLGHEDPNTATAFASTPETELRQQSDGGKDSLDEAAAINRIILDWTSTLFGNLDSLIQANEVLAKRSHFLLDLARSIHIFALNAGLASSILGVEGHALEAVTKQLQDTSKDIVRTIEHATTGVEEAIRLIREVGFMISISTLQSEMVDFEIAVLDSDEAGGERIQAAQSMETLSATLLESLCTVFDLSEEISTSMSEVSGGSSSLFSLLDLLQFELLAGRIEIARLADRRGFVDMFSEISAQLIEAESEIRKFGEETANAASLIEQFDLQQGRTAAARLKATSD